VPPLLQFFKRSASGSTIVAVLAALVFIGIVIAAMVRHTDSQSTVSRGYGAAMTMSSTVSSGIVATESYFLNPANANVIIGKIQSIIDTPANKPFILGSANGKLKLADGQYFRSRLVKFDLTNMYATFEVESGKNEKGKSLKKALAAYSVDGLETSGGGSFPGNSTLFMGGNMQASNKSMRVKGYATFMDDFTTNDGGSGIAFEPDAATGEGNVLFNAAVNINDASVKFKTPVFFNDDAVIPRYTNDTMFYGNVGFNKNFSTERSNKYLGLVGNMWIKEGLRTRSFENGMAKVPLTYIDQSSEYNVRMNGYGSAPAGGNLYYTDSLPAKNTDGTYNGSNCHSQGVLEYRCFSFQNSLSNITYNGNQQNFDAPYILDKLGMAKEADAVRASSGNSNMAAEIRKISEPVLNPQNISGAGKQFLTLDSLIPYFSGGGQWSAASVSLNDINGWYAKYPEVDYPQYYNEGHLLVKLNGSLAFNDANNKTFDNKIAFIVDDGYNINSKYYNSGPNASTLIYAGPKGQLNMEFQKNFRGLIYVDDNNECGVGANGSPGYNKQNTFTWGPDCQIDGAVLLKGKGRMNWNTSAGGPAVFTRNEEILKAFAGFVTGSSGGGADKNLGVKPGGIALKPLGYYYDLK
jgi:hypothetical protein